ncbi:ABC transporter permease [Amnibacterium setariae]|uniref:ABC transporter permease n=1 Tax=Amnibacterium setariae TaxID=2306585 RepID=A0A3A1U233_9MICO|nr:ABC transporter permease [Amnibacterium setariae]RIX30433.1 ABC transporter permease [Amnibacterium setariae]
MLRFLATRVALLLLGLLVAAVLIFAVLRVLPGDVAQVVGGTQASAAQVARIRSELGLDRPVVLQFLDWIGGVARLDLGRSLVTGSPVAAELGQKLEVTLPLAGLSLLFGLGLGLPLGVLSAVLHRRAGGFLIAAAAQLLAAVPVVFAGVLLILLLGSWLHLLPVQGFPLDGWRQPGRAFASLILPALTIGVVEGAVVLRFTRSATLEALGQDHVRAAAARGMTLNRALVVHGLPGVLLSVVSVIGLEIAALLVGAVVVEQLFQLPGVGRMLVADVGNRDLVKVQSELLVLTGLILVVGAVVDVVHRLVDPREREAA